MKKIILLLTLSFGVLSCQQLMAQPPVTQTQGHVKFYYYPSSNVYFNPATNSYWYWNSDNSTWTSGNELPASITLNKNPRQEVYYNGQEVWRENGEHLRKYKVKKNGRIKEKPMKHEKED